jgi:predicted flap endonuclease-1-like 5' DNA nuclease
MEGIDPRAVELLAAEGIRSSRHLFERAAGGKNMGSLSELTGISLETLEHLLALSDLVRAYGVGPVFAELLYDAGVQSLQEFKSYTPHEIIQLYEERTGKRADFTLSDLQFSLD